jgi:two-component system cell cycle sensor histidine kinase/response regulator CckA
LWLVKADQTELGRVFVNLAVNAVDAMPAGGTLTIRTCNMARVSVEKLGLSGLVPADYVMCQVADTGQGMTHEILEKIFEPFFTTKEVGKGTGLGLSTVYGIVKQTGGYIYCDSTPGVGSSFRIFLPKHIAGSVRNDVQIKVERKEKPRDLTGSGTVLLVEDEESVRRFAARALRRQGYVVLEAGNGIEALEIKASHRGAIDVVVSDIVMPEMDGPTLLKELRKESPQLKIIFMSGYADDALSSLDNNEEFAFLAKPFQLSDLVSAVKELIPA